MKNLLLIFACILLVVGCSDDDEIITNDSTEYAPHDYQSIEGVDYSYDHETTTLNWSAYKYTERASVKGTFDDIRVSGLNISSNPIEVIETLQFEINTSSINSDLEFRDMNIINYFFNALKNNTTISGVVSRCEGNGTEGILYINLNINDIVKEIPFNYLLEGTQLSLVGDFDLGDFNALNAMDNMKNCCESVHTGADGIYLVWPEIKIEITTELYEIEI